MGHLLTNPVADFLRCPVCGTGPLAAKDNALACPACRALYPFDPALGVAALLRPDPLSPTKRDIQNWWGDLYGQLYAATDRELDRDSLDRMLVELEDLFRVRRHLAVVEMPIDALAGQRVLEIGPGGGGHSALFAKKGARVTALDLTPERAASTARKLRLVGDGSGRAYLGDAENLPFADASFDIVYSNGVLHHSESTERGIAEVHRVLRPGGKAVLMLYARHSAVYWANIVPRALFSGQMFGRPEAEWAGRVTEGKPKLGATRNPITRIYSERELRQLLGDFADLRLRKTSFQWDNFAIPKLTQLRRLIRSSLGGKPHPGGVLIYGEPFWPETALEQVLGRFLGFAWNIVATKA